MLVIEGLVVTFRGNGGRVQAFKDQQMSINWHKLYAVTMALALWGPQLKGKHLLFHCDNALWSTLWPRPPLVVKP